MKSTVFCENPSLRSVQYPGKVGKACLQEMKEKLSLAEVILETTRENIHRCKSCREGDMVVVKLLPPVRGSPRSYQQ